MEIVTHNIEDWPSGARMVEGAAVFTQQEIIDASRRAGSYHGMVMEIAIKTMICEYLKIRLISQTYEIYSCVVVPAPADVLRTWSFGVIAFSRFG